MITKPTALILSGLLAVSASPVLALPPLLGNPDAAASAPALFPDPLPLAERPFGGLQFGQLTTESTTEPPPQIGQPERKPDIHYVPTPEAVVAEMLKTAKVNKDDVVYDLGCGDGRIVITAAKEHGAKGIGIDIDPQRIHEAKENAKNAGVEDQVKFMVADLFKSDFSDASVITLYLLSSLNQKLRPKIFAETKPGTRIVSHAFSMGDWEPDEEKRVASNDVYYWVVPANISGVWKTTGKGQETGWSSATLEQTFQKFSGTAETKEGKRKITNGRMKGNEFTATVESEDGESFKISGTIKGDSMETRVEGSSEGPYTAERESGSKKEISTPPPAV